MSAIAALLYLLLPLCAVAVTARRAWQKRSTTILRPLLATFVSAAVIGFALNFVYAQAAAAQWLWTQVLLSAWFIAGVLLVLKGFDAGLRRASAVGARRLSRLLKPRGQTATGIALRVVLLFALGMPYVMALAMVYRPKVRGPDPLQQLGVTFQDVTFGDSSLAGWWIPAKPGTDTVLLCHGLGASKSNALPMADHLLRAGYNVFAIDFRAHGSSAGQVTTFGDAERRDVLAAVKWLRRERPEQSKRILGLGASMGAAALIAAAGDDSDDGRAIAAIAVYGTYDELGGLTRTVCDRHFPTPLNWLGRYIAVPVASLHAGTNLQAFVPAEHLARLPPRPIFIIHGKDDEIIAFEHGRRLFERASEPKYALWLDGDHNSVLNDPQAARAVREFFGTSHVRKQ